MSQVQLSGKAACRTLRRPPLRGVRSPVPGRRGAEWTQSGGFAAIREVPMDEDERTSRDEAAAADIDATADGGAPSAQNGTPLPIAQQCVEALTTTRVEGIHSSISRPTAALCARCSRDRRSVPWWDTVLACRAHDCPYTRTR